MTIRDNDLLKFFDRDGEVEYFKENDARFIRLPLRLIKRAMLEFDFINKEELKQNLIRDIQACEADGTDYMTYDLKI